jgi:hypothetical protein
LKDAVLCGVGEGLKRRNVGWKEREDGDFLQISTAVVKITVNIGRYRPEAEEE